MGISRYTVNHSSPSPSHLPLPVLLPISAVAILYSFTIGLCGSRCRVLGELPENLHISIVNNGKGNAIPGNVGVGEGQARVHGWEQNLYNKKENGRKKIN